MSIQLEKSPPVLLADRIAVKCRGYMPALRKKASQFPITTNRRYKLLFCPMCKLASTFWTKFFKMLEVYNNNKTKVNSPFDIPIKIAKPTAERLSITDGTSVRLYNDYFKFMFVRDPYARILSAYVDKIFAPNPTFWEMWKMLLRKLKIGREKGHSHAKCGSDVTFQEYIQAIVVSHIGRAKSGSADCHDATYLDSCHPCELNMNFIGKMEQFSSDSLYLYQKFNLSRTIETLHKQGKQLADDDALQDTIISPFLWKQTIKKCIPWLEALKRVWRKLQIRGVIGKEQLPLTAEQAEQISAQEFIDLVRMTKEKTPYSERKKQRTEALIEIFSSVKPELLQQLKLSYKNDFYFFEYDDSPYNIFNISRKDIQYYGYLDV